MRVSFRWREHNVIRKFIGESSSNFNLILSVNKLAVIDRSIKIRPDSGLGAAKDLSALGPCGRVVVAAAVAAVVVPALVAAAVVLALVAVGNLVLAEVGTYQEAAAGPFAGVVVAPVLLVPTGSAVEPDPACVLAADREGRTGRYEAAGGCTKVDTDPGAANPVLVAEGTLVAAVGILVAVVPVAEDSLAVAVGIPVAVDSPAVHHFQEKAENCNAPKVRTPTAHWAEVQKRLRACSLLVPTKLYDNNEGKRVRKTNKPGDKSKEPKKY